MTGLKLMKVCRSVVEMTTLDESERISIPAHCTLPVISFRHIYMATESVFVLRPDRKVREPGAERRAPQALCIWHVVGVLCPLGAWERERRR